MEKKTFNTKKPFILVLLLFVIVGMSVGVGIYLSDYYHADYDAMQAFDIEQNYTVESPKENVTAYVPEQAIAGMIFYPGGKVEHTAYQPLMELCASKGILSVLVEMPFRLAVFSVDAAEGIQELFPEVEAWYIGGHSLGGSMAATYVAEHVNEYEGLILLGSYSTAVLSKSGLEVLSVYGSNDEVLNRKKYDKNKSNLSADFVEYVIEGGCHAYFGVYGMQEGDGVPTISVVEQITITANMILEFVQP